MNDKEHCQRRVCTTQPDDPCRAHWQITLSTLYFAAQPNGMTGRRTEWHPWAVTQTSAFKGVPAKSTRLLRNGFKFRMDFSSIVRNCNYEQQCIEVNDTLQNEKDVAATWDLVFDVWKQHTGHRTTPKWMTIWYLMVQLILLLILSSAAPLLMRLALNQYAGSRISWESTNGLHR